MCRLWLCNGFGTNIGLDLCHDRWTQQFPNKTHSNTQHCAFFHSLTHSQYTVLRVFVCIARIYATRNWLTQFELSWQLIVAAEFRISMSHPSIHDWGYCNANPFVFRLKLIRWHKKNSVWVRVGRDRIGKSHSNSVCCVCVNKH